MVATQGIDMHTLEHDHHVISPKGKHAQKHSPDCGDDDRKEMTYSDIPSHICARYLSVNILYSYDVSFAVQYIYHMCVLHTHTCGTYIQMCIKM